MPASEAVAGNTRSEPMDVGSKQQGNVKYDSSIVKLGKTKPVQLGNRMCWVKEPNAIIDENSIPMWPGLEYASFEEVIEDSFDNNFCNGYSNFIKNNPDLQDKAVVVGFKGSKYFIRVIKSDAHREGRVVKYGDTFNWYYNDIDRTLPEYELLKKALEICISKVQEGGGEVSPVPGQAHAYIEDKGSLRKRTFEDADEETLIASIANDLAEDEKENVPDQKKHSFWGPNFDDGAWMLEKQNNARLTHSKRKKGIHHTPLSTTSVANRTRNRAAARNRTRNKAVSQPSPKPQLIWKTLKEVYGWTSCGAPSSKYPLDDYLYIRPGFTKMDTLGEHCFLSEQAAVNYALEHPDILQVPTMSAVPLSKKASSSRNGSSSQSAVDILAKKKSSDKRQQNLKAPATESNLQKAFGVENANSWWQRHKVPGIKDTKRSLEKFGMTRPKENGHAYKMPNGTICKSVPDLQKYLCKHGLPANASTELSEDELSVLMRWISIAHLPRYVGTVDLHSDQGQKALMDLPGGESFSDADAWKILRDECGAEKIEGDGSFFVPFEDKDSTRYKSIADIRQYIRANGIKLQGWGTPNELIICVLLWASVLPVPIEKVVKKECNNTEEEEDTNEGGSVSTILSSMFSWLSWRKKAPVKSE